MRFLRGAELADRGVVTDLKVAPGELRGTILGSRREAYTVNISTPITGVPMGAGSPIRWSCTCPDWGDPCKHAVAVLLVVSQRFDADPDLVETFAGANPHGATLDDLQDVSPVKIPESKLAMKVQPGPTTPETVPLRSTGLPSVAPLWAESLGIVDGPSTIEQFFGVVPLGKSPSSLASDQPTGGALVGPDRLRQLGPLIVDDYDLAPDVIRMYTGLSED